MSVRAVELATGREFSLSIQKAGSPVILGCASNVDYSGQKEVLTANCQSGKKQIPAGDDPTYTLAVTGFYHIYSAATQAANISATEIELFMQTSTLISWVFKGPHVGDPVRTGTGYVTQFGFGTPVEGLVTYNFTITPFAMPVITTNP
jgi:hypothetical protein